MNSSVAELKTSDGRTLVATVSFDGSKDCLVVKLPCGSACDFRITSEVAEVKGRVPGVARDGKFLSSTTDHDARLTYNRDVPNLMPFGLSSELVKEIYTERFEYGKPTVQLEAVWSLYETLRSLGDRDTRVVFTMTRAHGVKLPLPVVPVVVAVKGDSSSSSRGETKASHKRGRSETTTEVPVPVPGVGVSVAGVFVKTSEAFQLLKAFHNGKGARMAIVKLRRDCQESHCYKYTSVTVYRLDGTVWQGLFTNAPCEKPKVCVCETEAYSAASAIPCPMDVIRTSVKWGFGNGELFATRVELYELK